MWDIDKAQEMWTGLSGKLKVLELADLSPSAWNLIQEIKENPTNPQGHVGLPLTVARFSASKQREISERLANMDGKYNFAITDTAYRTEDSSPSNETSFQSWAQAITADYRRDIDLIHKTLFGASAYYAKCHFGFFSKPIKAGVHGDHTFGKACCAYISRVNALPLWSISSEKLSGASPEILDIIETAKDDGPLGKIARQDLEKKEILTPLPLGDVALFLASSMPGKATLHCGSEVPQRGEYSILFHAVGQDFG